MPNPAWINPRVFRGGQGTPAVNASQLNEITTNLAILGNKDSARAYSTVASKLLPVNRWSVLGFNRFRGNNAALMWDQNFSGRLTVQRAGLYLINGVVRWKGSAAGVFGTGIAINSTTGYPGIVAATMKYSGATSRQNITTLWLCAAQDYIQLIAQPHTVAGTVMGSGTDGDYSCELSAVWLSN